MDREVILLAIDVKCNDRMILISGMFDECNETKVAGIYQGPDGEISCLGMLSDISLQLTRCLIVPEFISSTPLKFHFHDAIFFLIMS